MRISHTNAFPLPAGRAQPSPESTNRYHLRILHRVNSVRRHPAFRPSRLPRARRCRRRRSAHGLRDDYGCTHWCPLRQGTPGRSPPREQTQTARASQLLSTGRMCTGREPEANANHPDRGTPQGSQVGEPGALQREAGLDRRGAPAWCAGSVRRPTYSLAAKSLRSARRSTAHRQHRLYNAPTGPCSGFRIV
jgi:hypothetical protein